jgi:hypothetical protein
MYFLLLIPLILFLVVYIINPSPKTNIKPVGPVYRDDLVVVSPQTFYTQYFGHPLDDLMSIYARIRESEKNIIWLAGDSTMDNKHWLFEDICEKRTMDSYTIPPQHEYKNLLVPPSCIPDIAACINSLTKDTNYVALNCAIEESSLSDRQNGMLAHDHIIKSNIRENDVLIVSVGGNDIGLKPCFKTIFWMVAMWILPFNWIPPHIYHIFHTQLKSYIMKLTKRKKPKLVIVCMFYYPCEHGRGWIDRSFAFQMYKRNATKAKQLLDLIFYRAISKINIPFINIEYMHLGHVLDSRDKKDYVSRVEPSKKGGEKIAAAFYQTIFTNKIQI